MSLQRVFLIASIVTFTAAVLLFFGAVLFKPFNVWESNIFLAAVAIGGYSLLAMCCATIYRDPQWHTVAVLGFGACVIGLAFALLTDWRIISPKIGGLLKGRFAFLSVAVALAATALMLRLASSHRLVQFSRNATIFLIWMATSLFNFILFFVLERFFAAGSWNYGWSFALAYISSILSLLGLIITPILRKVYS